MLRLTDEQWERVKVHFPEEDLPTGRRGRKPIPVRKVLEAALWVRFDDRLKEQGVEMITPHRKNRKRRKTQDERAVGPSLKCDVDVEIYLQVLKR